jgi:hypothetical protein
VVTRTIEVYDNEFMTVAAGSPSLSPGSAIVNNSDTPDGTVFQFAGGSPVVVTLDDTSSDPNVLEDDDYSHHTISDGGGLVATSSGVEAESLIFVRALDEFGNQIGPTITITVFSQGNNGQDIWAFHSDAPLVAGGQYEKTSGDNIGSASYSSISSQPVCYAPGTQIDTPDGPRAVETLGPGDLVLTRDHGPQPIRWVHSGEHPLENTEVDCKPILIAAGALGKGLPAQDLIVSPQHKILLGGYGQLEEYFDLIAFAPAKALTQLRGIRHMNGKTKITWVHFACDRHEIVTANGCLSESLLLGTMAVNGLTAAERQTVIDLFGPAQIPGAALNGPPALKCLKVGAVRRQLKRSLEAKIKLLAKEISKWDVDAAMERHESVRLRDIKDIAQARVENVA